MTEPTDDPTLRHHAFANEAGASLADVTTTIAEPGDAGTPDAVAAPASGPTSVPRFAQLTYTSYRPAGHADGGWQVKDVLGGLTADEQRDLVGEIATGTLPLDPNLPAFPSSDQRAALPRRLVHARVGGGAAYWHTVPAGNDSTNRPRNVFAHVLLDRRPEDADLALRPSDLLRSPMWLRPFGPTEVAGAAPAPIERGPEHGPLDREAVAAFLVREAGHAPGVLAGLLDAVAAALQGHDRSPQVVLLAERERAEQWIAGISHLMSAGTSRTLCWSTLEQPGDLAKGPIPGLHLVVVDPASAQTIDAPPSVVLIPDDPYAVGLGDLASGEPHRTLYGEIPVTAWSAIAPVVLQDEAVATDVLDCLDACAARAGDHDLTCAWPLAMAVCQAPERFADAREEAESVLLSESPPHLDLETRQVIRALQTRTLGRTPGDAWDAYENPARRPGIRDSLAASVYLDLALADPSWLMRPGGPPRPRGMSALEPDTVERARRSLRELYRLADPGGPKREAAVLALRTVDLCLAAGIADPGDGPRGDVAAVIDRIVIPALRDAGTARVVIDDAFPLTDATRVAVRDRVDQWLPRSPHPVGDRLPPLVLAFLFPTPPATPDLRRVAARIPPCLVELAAQVTAVVPDPSAFRALAVHTAVTERPVDAPGLRYLASGPPLRPAELIVLLEHSDPPALAQFLNPVLLREPDGEVLHQLVEAVRAWHLGGEAPPDEATDPIVVPAAQVRFYASTWTETPNYVTRRQIHLVNHAEALLRYGEFPDLPSTVAGSMLAAHVVDVVAAFTGGQETEPRPRLEEWGRRAAGRLARPAADRITTAVDAGRIREIDVVLAAQLSARPDHGLPPLPGWEKARLADIRVRIGESTGPLLDFVVRRWVRAWDARSRADVVDDVRREVSGWITAAGSARETHRLLEEHDEFARNWWSEVGIKPTSANWFNRR